MNVEKVEEINTLTENSRVRDIPVFCKENDGSDEIILLSGRGADL
jgi:hypothetical protein